MDVLSSMATIAGYKAVLLAANHLPKMFPMMMTAAGTLSPAKALVVGAGVAGLQAIASARRLGAVVQAYDVRPAVKEQIESLGAKFVQLDLETAGAEDKGGYAKALTEEQQQRQREQLANVVAGMRRGDYHGRDSGQPVAAADHRRRRAPHGQGLGDRRSRRRARRQLRADEAGRNRRGKRRDDPRPHNLPSEVPHHASQMFAKNVATFLKHLMKNGALQIDAEDEITRETLITRGGEVVHPRDSGAPRRPSAESGWGGERLGDTGMDLLVVGITIFVLAIFVGFEVIAKGASLPAYAPDVGLQRHQRDHRHRCDSVGANLAHGPDEVARVCGRGLCDDQRRRRFPGHPPHARHVPPEIATWRPPSSISRIWPLQSCSFWGWKGLSHPRTAVRGNLLGAIGMLLAIAVTLLDRQIVSYEWIAGGAALGAVIGALMAQQIRMTAMPQMVALLNGFGGLCRNWAVGAALNRPVSERPWPSPTAAPRCSFRSRWRCPGLIGAVTFWEV